MFPISQNYKLCIGDRGLIFLFMKGFLSNSRVGIFVVCDYK